jgi:type I restriction enzyme R subunit
MTEFKQIIGRGTRINETYGKLYFTIMDFRNVTRLFADPDFDGDPVQIYEPKDDDPITPPEEEIPEEFSDTVNEPSEPYGETPDVSITEGEDGTSKPTRHTVSGVKVKVLNKRVQYIGADGKLITESLVDYSRKNIKKAYANLDAFLQEWSTAEQKEAIIKALSDQGVFFDELESEVGKEGLDPFDLICHIAFDRPALTRAERAGKLKKNNYFEKYTGIAKEVINALLDKYTESGIESIEDIGVLRVPPFNEYGTMTELTKLFGGGRAGYQSLIKEIEQHLYAS